MNGFKISKQQSKTMKENKVSVKCKKGDISKPEASIYLELPI